MAGTGSARGGLGWVILVVALAVPGVLFYNWWSHLKADREKTVAAKARGRVPDGGVFLSSPNNKLVNPMAPAVSTAAAAAPSPRNSARPPPGYQRESAAPWPPRLPPTSRRPLFLHDRAPARAIPLCHCSTRPTEKRRPSAKPSRIWRTRRPKMQKKAKAMTPRLCRSSGHRQQSGKRPQGDRKRRGLERRRVCRKHEDQDRQDK